MKNLKEAHALIKAQEKILDVAKKEIDRLKAEALKKFSPIQTGDVVHVTGYTHRGKPMLIDNLYLHIGGEYKTPVVSASGHVLNKANKPSKMRASYSAPVKEAKPVVPNPLQM